MSAEKPDPFDKTKILLGVPPMPAEATQILPAPVETKASSPAPKPAVKARRGGAVAIWIIAVLALTGGMTWWLLGPRSSGPAAAVEPEPAEDNVPPALQGYLAAAKQGDAKAMRMLGASYTYGLGVRADPATGAGWYRKAAAAGDKMAESELRAAGAR